MVMLWAFKQLGSPIKYLAIRQGNGFFESKWVYDFVLPAIFALATVTLIFIYPTTVGFFSPDKGIIVGIINLLNLLIAFFIAALAAVATFNRDGLDNEMKGRAALLWVKTANDVEKPYPLTHRQFVCYLFGYLSFISLAMLIGLHFLRLFSGAVIALLPTSFLFYSLIRIVAVWLFFFFVWQIVFTMFLGIYFLCDRLQFMNDPEV